MRVRRATWDNAEPLANLFAEYLRESYNGHAGSTAAQLQRDVLVDAPRQNVLLAESGEHLAGLCGVERGERIHAIIMPNAPDLAPTLWYGMPAYAKDGKVVCFFQSGQKFKTRYAT